MAAKQLHPRHASDKASKGAPEIQTQLPRWKCYTTTKKRYKELALNTSDFFVQNLSETLKTDNSRVLKISFFQWIF